MNNDLQVLNRIVVDKGIKKIRRINKVYLNKYQLMIIVLLKQLIYYNKLINRFKM